MVLWGALVVVVSVLAFVLLDPILAAFGVILLVTAAVAAFLGRDWDRHSTFEERELVRAGKRAGKWERNKDVRARDRAKWEAHQARQAESARRAEQEAEG
jgi:hypothetical protein